MDNKIANNTQITGAEIARMAGVTRAAVSNWKARGLGFPAPVAYGPHGALYDRDEAAAWVAQRPRPETTSNYVKPAKPMTDELYATLAMARDNVDTVARIVGNLPLTTMGAHADRVRIIHRDLSRIGAELNLLVPRSDEA